jgi:hypothetical protein
MINPQDDVIATVARYIFIYQCLGLHILKIYEKSIKNCICLGCTHSKLAQQTMIIKCMLAVIIPTQIAIILNKN